MYEDSRAARRARSRLFWLAPAPPADPEPIPGLWEPEKDDAPAEPVVGLVQWLAARLRPVREGLWIVVPRWALRADRDRLEQVGDRRLTRIRLLESQLRMHGIEPWVSE